MRQARMKACGPERLQPKAGLGVFRVCVCVCACACRRHKRRQDFCGSPSSSSFLVDPAPTTIITQVHQQPAMASQRTSSPSSAQAHPSSAALGKPQGGHHAMPAPGLVAPTRPQVTHHPLPTPTHPQTTALAQSHASSKGTPAASITPYRHDGQHHARRRPRHQWPGCWHRHCCA